jgi:hypothetical protein
MEEVHVEQQRETDLLGQLNRLLASTENNIFQNRRMLAEVQSCRQSEEQQSAEDSLCDLLAQNIRTKKKVQSFIEYLELRMADNKYEVTRFSRF